MPPPPPDNAFEEPGAGWRPAGAPPTPAAGGRDVYSVSRLVNAARVALERGLGTLWVEGEVSNLARPASGHLYFTLKDGQSQVRCAMFRQRALLVRTPPRDGQQVLLRARVTMYEPRGEFQLVVDSLEDAGEGLLRRRFDELKGRLAGEGLFDVERKRPLPALPRAIGVVTSPSGAAIRDILHVLSRRFPAVPVVIYPTLVQGAGSVPQIVAALQAASRRREVDVLIVARGGGSLEDLWSFNEEAVARAIAACPMPVVSGVGHETDVTIADFVADVRAPTPSAAAELVVPDAAAWLRRARQSGARLQQGAQRLVARARERTRWLEARLAQAGPAARLEALAQRLDDLDRRLAAAARARVARPVGRLAAAERRLALASPLRRLSRLREQQAALARRLAAAGPRSAVAARQRLALAARTLQAVSPLATLGRGYALVTATDGHLVTSTARLAAGTRIDVRLADGTVRATVDSAVQDSTTAAVPPPVRE